MELLCPILSNKEPKKCMENKCAWWDNEKKCCAIRTISEMTSAITGDGYTTLDDISQDIKSAKSK